MRSRRLRVGLVCSREPLERRADSYAASPVQVVLARVSIQSGVAPPTLEVIIGRRKFLTDRERPSLDNSVGGQMS